MRGPWAFVPVEVAAVAYVRDCSALPLAHKAVRDSIKQRGGGDIETYENTTDASMRGAVEVYGSGIATQRYWRVFPRDARRWLFNSLVWPWYAPISSWRFRRSQEAHE